ncbi:MAG: hypothetical protein M0R77_14605 [Gammaproteobacteria bacterium]|nr:hypothetical protein [Gammaproteobacteria bacterium]
MIVRILDEGQYRLDSRFVDRLNEIDDMLVAVVAGSGAGSFDALFAQMLELVRTNGEPLGDSELAVSDVVLPSPSMGQDDLRALFTDEGVVPG